jgi:sulfur carrier protein
MKIICNGEEYFLEEGMRLPQFLLHLGLSAETVAIEYNGRIVAIEERDTLVLEEGANLELIRFVGGGA